MSSKLRSNTLFIIPFITTLLSALGLFVALKTGWLGTPGMVAMNYCELSHDSLIKQPANTWSNLGFLIVGWMIAFQTSVQQSTNSNLITNSPFYSILLSSIAILICFGSMAMHASTTIVGGYLDVLSMFLFASFMFSYAIKRLLKVNNLFILILFIATVGFSILSYKAEIAQQPLLGFINANVSFGFFCGFPVIIEIYLMKSKRIKARSKFLLLFAFCFAFAFLIWNLSLSGGIICFKESIVQGHAIWHLLCALAIYFLFKYYQSETVYFSN